MAVLSTAFGCAMFASQYSFLQNQINVLVAVIERAVSLYGTFIVGTLDFFLNSASDTLAHITA